MARTATATFFADGRMVTEGDELEPSDPIIKGRESLFTAEPPAKKAPAKKAAGKSK